MIIVNTTFIIHTSIDPELRDWIRRSYAESAARYRVEGMPVLFTKVLADDNNDANSYAIHIYFPDLESAKKWNEGVGASLREIMSRRWGERALSFHTYLEVTE